MNFQPAHTQLLHHSLWLSHLQHRYLKPSYLHSLRFIGQDLWEHLVFHCSKRVLPSSHCTRYSLSWLRPCWEVLIESGGTSSKTCFSSSFETASSAIRRAYITVVAGVFLFNVSTRSRGCIYKNFWKVDIHQGSSKDLTDRPELSCTSGFAPAWTRISTTLVLRYPEAMWSGVYPSLSFGVWTKMNRPPGKAVLSPVNLRFLKRNYFCYFI